MTAKIQALNQINMISGHYVYTIIGFSWTPVIKNAWSSNMKYNLMNSVRYGLPKKIFFNVKKKKNIEK